MVLYHPSCHGYLPTTQYDIRSHSVTWMGRMAPWRDSRGCGLLRVQQTRTSRRNHRWLSPSCLNFSCHMIQRDRTGPLSHVETEARSFSHAGGWCLVDAVSLLQIFFLVRVEMKDATQYDRNVKPHEWDFTVSTRRDGLSGGNTLQAASTIKAAHTLFHQGAIGIKAVGWHIVQSLRRIVP